MNDHVECPYCTDTPAGINLLKHVFSKHEKNFFHKKNIDLLHQQSQHIERICPPYFFMLTEEYYCCFGCMKAVKKEYYAVKHFPKCFEAHKAKFISLVEKYPL